MNRNGVFADQLIEHLLIQCAVEIIQYSTVSKGIRAVTDCGIFHIRAADALHGRNRGVIAAVGNGHFTVKLTDDAAARFEFGQLGARKAACDRADLCFACNAADVFFAHQVRFGAASFERAACEQSANAADCRFAADVRCRTACRDIAENGSADQTADVFHARHGAAALALCDVGTEQNAAHTADIFISADTALCLTVGDRAAIAAAADPACLIAADDLAREGAVFDLGAFCVADDAAHAVFAADQAVFHFDIADLRADGFAEQSDFDAVSRRDANAADAVSLPVENTCKRVVSVTDRQPFFRIYGCCIGGCGGFRRCSGFRNDIRSENRVQFGIACLHTFRKVTQLLLGCDFEDVLGAVRRAVSRIFRACRRCHHTANRKAPCRQHGDEILLPAFQKGIPPFASQSKSRFQQTTF